MMNAFFGSILQIFKGAAKAFQTFPASIASALAFALVTMVRIQMDWPRQQSYELLFNSLQWAIALGAIFGLAVITAAQSRFNNARAFLAANVLAAASVVVAFLALYLPGGSVSGLDAARMGAVLLVSFLAFIVLAGYPEEQSDFSRAFFMTHKAFFIALLYGLVIMGGTSGVVFAIEALIYPAMSEKVYQHVGTLAGFLAFTIFAGYFPDFRKGQVDEQREVAQKQPRFIEVLFGYIMIPIVLALTAVLLIWTGRIIVTGQWPNFYQLTSIATGYAVGGIWLHILVTHYETALAKFYRRVYPITALVILAFEAWALVNQLRQFGLRMNEYTFILVWIVAVAAAFLLIFIKTRAHTVIVAVASALAIVSVLPFIGYIDLPVSAQVSRLENLLTTQGILQAGQLTPAVTVPEQSVREQVTEAVNYLAYTEDAKLPDWFDTRLAESQTFKAKLGFEQKWPTIDAGPTDYSSTSVMLPMGAVDISEYRWALRLEDTFGKGNTSVTVTGENGTYTASWSIFPQTGLPTLKIELDGRVLIEQDMIAFVEQIQLTFPPNQDRKMPGDASFEDLSLQIETEEIKALLVFNNVEIYSNGGQINYYFGLNNLYLKEKP